MILSFHPVISGEENIICAGRPPGPNELEALSRAEAVIVPQGTREDLYRLVRSHCPLVWPNYDARFDYPGKVGQAHLFSRHQVRRPPTVVYPSLTDFISGAGDALPKPYVLKSNHGGEGHGVYPIFDGESLEKALAFLQQDERNQRGGLVQQPLIDHGGRDLRVVVIGEEAIAYWRYASGKDNVLTNLSQGGSIRFDEDRPLMEAGIQAARDLARKACIDLAGFDLMFDRRQETPEPLFIEINYYFGRNALGGSNPFYKKLNRAADRWLKRQGLKRSKDRRRSDAPDRVWRRLAESP